LAGAKGKRVEGVTAWALKPHVPRVLLPDGGRRGKLGGKKRAGSNKKVVWGWVAGMRRPDNMTKETIKRQNFGYWWQDEWKLWRMVGRREGVGIWWGTTSSRKKRRNLAVREH